MEIAPIGGQINRNEHCLLSPLEISSRSKNFLPFKEAERLPGSSPSWRTNAACWRDHRKDRRGFPVKSASDRTHRLASLPAIPDLRPLSRRVINATSLFHAPHSIFAKD